MPKPTFEQLKTWAENYPKLWNAGDKQAWIDNYKQVAPGTVQKTLRGEGVPLAHRGPLLQVSQRGSFWTR